MIEIIALWWVWLALALVLGILEILIAGFVFLGFAFGALMVGLMLLNTGLSPTPPLLFLLFAALSLVAWLILRKVFESPKGQVRKIEDDVND